jgi:purine-nucleoside phosphorylase
MPGVSHAVSHIRNHVQDEYPVGIILGTGLGGLVDHIDVTHTLEYSSIPRFPIPTVEFHGGKLIFGRSAGKNIVAMSGRFHYYEGYGHSEITFPVHVLKELGVKVLIVSNACGALNPNFRKSELMAITSHINLHFTGPLIGAGMNLPMNNVSSNPYSKNLTKLLSKIALKHNIELRKGTYVTVSGPNLETRAEYRMLRLIGADVVGMSTVPEALIADKLGIKVVGISIITDEGFADTLKPAFLKDILEAAAVAEPSLTLLTIKLIEQLEF